LGDIFVDLLQQLVFLLDVELVAGNIVADEVGPHLARQFLWHFVIGSQLLSVGNVVVEPVLAFIDLRDEPAHFVDHIAIVDDT
jgi:hypothetical protein